MKAILTNSAFLQLKAVLFLAFLGFNFGIFVPFEAYSKGKIPDSEGGEVKSSSNFIPNSFHSIHWAAPCGGISPLDCNEIKNNLPINLDFTANSGGLVESGFTMYLEQSKFMTPYTSLTPYDPTKISKTAAGLSITSTRGIFFSQQPDQGTPNSANTNTQVNALGVGFTVPTKKFSVSSRLVNPDFSVSAGSSAQQAGIWFGLDEDHYVKLAVVKNSTGNDRKIQLQVENMDITTSAAFLEINTGNIGTNTGEITLRLEFDPLANTVQGFYRLGSGPEVLVTSATTEPNIRPVPPSYFGGLPFDLDNPSENASFSGIFTTHRNSTGNPIVVLFKDFGVSEQLNTAKDITSFSIPGQIGTSIINTAPGTVSLEMPASADLSNLVPTIGLSEAASINPVSGVSGDFTSPKIYTVTAEDGSTKTWTITITQKLPIIAPYRMNVAGLDYTKGSDLFLAENSIYLAEYSSTLSVVSTTAYTPSPGDEPLYFPRRFSPDFGYNFPIANGSYEVKIHMVENFQTTSGARIFDILLEGGVVEDNLDLFASYGKGVLGIVTHPVTVTDGELNIRFTASQNNGLVQAIEVLPSSGPSLSSENKILTFSIPGASETPLIDEVNASITVNMPFGSNVTSLVPVFTVSSNATVNPESGIAQDFSNPVVYTVTAEDGTEKDWTIIVSVNPATPFEVKINFQNNPTLTTPPAGYLADFGQAFGSNSVEKNGSSYQYGWKELATGQPLDVTSGGTGATAGVGRNRLANYSTASVQEKLEGTLVHFQGDNVRNVGGALQWAGQARANEVYWEMQIPNGIYQVTLGLGDKGVTNLDSRHSATVEGYTIIPAFSPTAGEVRTASIIVEVSDGLLTINGLGGYNSKITHLEIVESAGTPVSGELVFDPSSLTTNLVPGGSGSFSAVLNGAGATNFGVVINDVINLVSPANTANNEWFTLPTSIDLGEVSFTKNASSLTVGGTRSDKIIATASGFKPAILDVTLEIIAQNIPPIILPQSFGVLEDVALGTIVGTVSASDENSDELTFSIADGNAGGAFAINSATGEITTAALLDFSSVSQYILTVQVTDGLAVESASITIDVEEVIGAIPCSPYSTIPCSQIVKALPVNLNFDGSQGGLISGNGIGTGFTMVDPYSGTRVSQDGVPSNPAIPAYEPSNLNISNGNLVMTASKGIAFINNNAQINTLGVGLQDIVGKTTIETKLLAINTGPNAAQAGIWFGIDDKNFVKLNVNGTNIEVRREIGDVSSTVATNNPDQIQLTGVITSGSDVTLRLEIDPTAQTITSFYAVGSGSFVQVTKTGFPTLALPPVYLDGLPSGDLTGTSFAGIYTSYRNNTVTFNATFDYFTVSQEEVVTPKILSFDQSALTFTGVVGETIPTQSANLSASTGGPAIILSDDPDSGTWLNIPTGPVLGQLVFGIKPGIPAGTYSTTIFAIDQPDQGYENAQITINATITDPSTPGFGININFSDPATAAPAGYEKDSGDPFGLRGNGFTYGWLDNATSQPSNLTLNGRNRNLGGLTVLDNTLIHMQYGDVSTVAANGYLPDAKWEIEVPNGTYQVKVAVGDPNVDGSTADTPFHTINVEGVNAINRYTPTGAAGSTTRGTTATVTVTVGDGRLTLDPGDGFNTKIRFVEVLSTTGEQQPPRVLGVNPANGATNVSVNTSVSANSLFLPNPGPGGLTSVDNSTITNATVKLTKQGSSTPIAASVNGTGGGDAISLVPSLPLEANTTYTFEINGVTDLAGVAFEPFTSSFTTGDNVSGPTTDLDNVSFTKFGQVATGSFTTLVIGPDGKLYGLEINGNIQRWTIAADGTLTDKQTLTAWKSAYSPRAAVGLEFDPNATAENLIAYITHQSATLSNAPDWDGKLSRISGSNLENEQLLVTNLPRSLRDHLTNSIAFKPGEANVLYFNQGSNSAGGAPDGAWGNREESMLSAATLRLDLSKLPAQLPLNAQTTRNLAAINAVDVNSPTLDGLYNPYYVNAPLTIFGSGIRNAYDLTWHTNGKLYVPANGTAGGSNSPASVNGTRRADGTVYDNSNPLYPPIPAINNTNVQRDWLFKIDPSAGYQYFGHPNPFRGEYVLNRGDEDVNNTLYNGILPDRNYKGDTFDFEFNKSPNGVIEYRSNAENGNLRGALLVVRYSGGSDIIALVPDGPNGDINTFKEGIPGFTGFGDPLDLIEDVNTGNIYVSDYSRNEIVLLKPSNQAAPTPQIVLSTGKVVGDAVTAGDATYTEEIILSNLGNAILSGITSQITGPGADQFTVTGLPPSVNSQNSSSFSVVFNPTSNGSKYATLTISGTNAEPVIVQLAGLGKTGTGGSNEPSLQWILDTHLGQGLVNVGDANPATNLIDLSGGASYNNLLGGELNIQQFQRATDAPVTVEVLSVYGPEANNPIVAFGWYNSGVSGSTQEVFTVQNTIAGNGQTLNPVISGSTEFDPGLGSFGFYSRWPFFGNRILYSEDVLNTFSGAIPHHVRVYAMPGETDAYIIATEEHISGFDYQDIVVIVRNVKPFQSSEEVCSPISLLPCEELEVTLPFNLNFNGSEGGLANTGFTMVDNPSARLAIDGTQTYANVPGFEPGRLSFSNGNLVINAANGISFVRNGTGTGFSTDVNSQINTLGAGFDANGYGNFSISSTVAAQFTDATLNSEQVGIWFGLNEDNFVKLVVANGGTIELRREINGASGNTDQVLTAAIPGANTQWKIHARIFLKK